MSRKNPFPYVKLRRQNDGSYRPRFEPGPRERAIGFRAEDLRHDDGRWFGLDEAAAFAKARLEEILAARATGATATGNQQEARSGLAATGNAKKVSDLLDAYFGSPDFKRLKPKTRADYEGKANAIRWQPRRAAGPKLPETMALAPAAAVRPAAVKAFFEYLVRERGLAMARGTVMVLSAAYKWARLADGWEIDPNPCTRLDLPAPPPDLTIFEAHELTALVRSADAAGDEAIGDAVILALLSDQRPTDVLAFAGGGNSEGVVRLIQSKTGRRIELPALPWLVVRLAAMGERRRAHGWTCPELIVDDRTGKRFTEREFNERWRRAIARAAVETPTLTGKKFKHIRKTTFTWLHRSGNDLPHIASVSGHTLGSIPQIAKHYLELDRDTAALAMSRLETWMTAQGFKL